MQSSIEGSGSESRDHTSKGGEAPPISRASLIQQPVALPESVTPFVTTHHPGQGVGGGKGEKKKTISQPSGLNIQTPFGVSSKQQSAVSDDHAVMMSTPANFHAQTSSEYSLHINF